MSSKRHNLDSHKNKARAIVYRHKTGPQLLGKLNQGLSHKYTTFNMFSQTVMGPSTHTVLYTCNLNMNYMSANQHVSLILSTVLYIS